MEAEGNPSDSVTDNASNKSQRKREREKQRRSDLASAFDELSNLITVVQGPQEPSERPTKKSKPEPDSALTRFDLIGGTIQCIRNLHRENQQLTRQLETQSRSLAAASSAKQAGGDHEEVLVMLPTLVPADERSASPHGPNGKPSITLAPAATSAAPSSSNYSSHNSAHPSIPNWNGYNMQPTMLPHPVYYPPPMNPQQQSDPAAYSAYYNQPYYYNMNAMPQPLCDPQDEATASVQDAKE
jgi:hypothetical protein